MKIRVFAVAVVAALALAAAADDVKRKAPPQRPDPISPIDNPTIDGSSPIRFEWKSCSNAASYTLMLTPCPNFTVPYRMLKIDAGRATSATVPGGLYPGKKYWWIVDANNAKGGLFRRSFPGSFLTAPRKDGKAGDGILRPSLLPDDCYMDDLPTVDISGDSARQAILADGTDAVYFGHAYTALAPDRHIVWAAFTCGEDHAKAWPGPLARSMDGGRTWERLDKRLPLSIAKRHCGSPVIRSVRRPNGSTRYIIFSRSIRRTLITTYSDDLGETWHDGPEHPIPTGMAPTGLVELKDGRTALFGQTEARKRNNLPANLTKSELKRFVERDIWMSVTADGGDTWSTPRIVATVPDRNLCEPCCIRAKDGRLVMLIREESQAGRSMYAISGDDGATWTKPADTPWGLTGDRHEGVCLSDGRLFIAFRDKARGSSMYGQYVAWVGTVEDLEKCRPGQYRIHLLQHYPDKRRNWSATDCGYSGVHELDDGTIVCVTYLKNAPDGRRQSVMSTRLKIAETDALWQAMRSAGAACTSSSNIPKR